MSFALSTARYLLSGRLHEKHKERIDYEAGGLLMRPLSETDAPEIAAEPFCKPFSGEETVFNVPGRAFARELLIE